MPAYLQTQLFISQKTTACDIVKWHPTETEKMSVDQETVTKVDEKASSDPAVLRKR